MNVDWASVSAALPAGLGAAVVMLVQQAAKYLRVQSIASKIRREARDGPAFGTPGWLYNEILRERGARHALQRDVQDLRERLARLDGLQSSPYRGMAPTYESGEQARVENDTDPVPAPPFRATSDVRRRSRP